MKAVPRRLLVMGGGPVGVEMAQAVRRLGGEVALVEGSTLVLAREPPPLGDALGEVLRRDGVKLLLGARATAARREGDDYVLELDDGHVVRGDRLSWPRAGARAWTASVSRPSASSQTRGAFPSTPTCAPASACGRSATSPGSGRSPTWANTRAASWRPTSSASRARPTTTLSARHLYDPQAAAAGATEAAFSATALVSEVAKTATYTRAYDESNGFLTLLSDGERLTGAYALGPEAGEWLQQATLAIRARVRLDVMLDTIQPFPTFSEIYLAALKALDKEIAAARAVPAS